MARNRIIPLFIPHAGCPCACVFCDQKKITGMGTPVTPDDVAREIEEALPWAGEGCQLAFYGGSFTAMKPETQETLLGAAEPYLRDGRIESIRLSTRPDAVDSETVARLKAYGVTTVELGCQSMDNRVLRLSGRGHTREDTIRASTLLHQGGLDQVLQMMTGLPGGDGEASVATAKALIALKPQGVRIYPTVVLRNTELHRMMLRGDYQPQSVESAVALCAELYELFLAADIPVIRVGLNPTEELSGGEAVAGAYDPALGERVLSRMYRNRAEKLLSAQPEIRDAVFYVHPRRISVMVGQKRENICDLRERFGLSSIKVRPIGGAEWDIFLKNQ